ncbi:MAG: response regulator transcription factor [Chloroflexi bacterium]|uniref:Response regulator transcription factor n=1 Tax=Candidatus Chlorohelix allophototropha TaxID=3003348 RepID=A0A8T7M6G6_9CHLR|nr:response regulator transcription factor [Chloroflexota bacterium]WJW69615.1 response regulator transcription factor [Chloroflexota bacterium L227-S17]
MAETTTPKILIIEDEESIWSLVKGYLEREDYNVAVATDGQSGLETARRIKPDLIVLDLMLPGIDGLEICHLLRAESDVYILMLTARTEEIDRIIGLTMGADDYVTKPFSPRELVARIKAALRRYRQDPSPVTSNRNILGTLSLEISSRKVWVKDQLLDLTRTEFDLLATLTEMPSRVFSREQLLEAVWSHDYFGDERVVDVHIGQLRKKIELASGGQPIKTVWGVGYRFEAEAGK